MIGIVHVYICILVMEIKYQIKSNQIIAVTAHFIYLNISHMKRTTFQFKCIDKPDKNIILHELH